ncbi:MAG: hypothetical protein JWM81_283 [Candidatus Saccharibacteria bacterium]|nr:hypothetical protein [Candidatus Saccharibacteria bacterium]
MIKPLDQKGIAHLVTIFVAVLVVGAVVAIGYKVSSSGHADTLTASTATVGKDAPTSSVVSPVQLAAKLKNYANQINAKQGIYKYQELKDETDGVVSYQARDTRYNVTSQPEANAGFVFTITSGDNTQAIVASGQALGDYAISQLGMKKIDTIHIAGEGDPAVYAVFQKGDALCSIRAQIVFAAGCVSQAKLEATAKSVMPFADLYLRGGGDNYDAYGPDVKISDGANGYKVAKLATNVNNLVFTQKPNTTDWHFFSAISSQTAPNCSIFDTDADAKLAFQGSSCTSGNTATTVK